MSQGDGVSAILPLAGFAPTSGSNLDRLQKRVDVSAVTYAEANYRVC